MSLTHQNDVWQTRFAIAIMTAIVSWSAASAAFAESLTISVWGGGYGEAWKKDVVDPYVEQTGVDVKLDLGRSSQRLSKLLATKGSGIDLFFITDHQMAVARDRGLLQAADPANIPNMANLYDFAKDPLGGGLCPAITLLGVGLIYNKDHYAQAPTSWLELERQDLPAKPALMDIAFSVAPTIVIRLAELKGGGIDAIDPGFALLSKQREHARFFQIFEVLDWVNQNEVSVAPMLNIFAKEDPNLPLRFTYPDDGILGVVNMACIIKGSPNKAAAEKFLDYYLSAPVQEKQAAHFGETPVVKNATIPQDIPYKLVPAEKFEQLIVYDASKIAQNRAAWMERFQEEVVAQ